MNVTQLSVISLFDNQLQGQVPSSISQLQNLKVLILGLNNLSGTVELDNFLKLKKLLVLQLSYNRLSCLTNRANPMFPQFHILALASCNLSEFPIFLQNQRDMNMLDISDNNIVGEVPMWVWNSSFNNLQYMNLSHNFLTSFDQYHPIIPLHMNTRDLSYNMLKGPLPKAPPSMMYYLVSKNNFTGALPLWICNLTGVLPSCLANNSKSLSMLNLERNRFFGRVPELFFSAVQLIMIDLCHNQLEDKLPRS